MRVRVEVIVLASHAGRFVSVHFFGHDGRKRIVRKKKMQRLFALSVAAFSAVQEAHRPIRQADFLLFISWVAIVTLFIFLF